ncbi:MAG: iron-sulfur cluster assembly protein [Haloarculaceae archaeon]
MSSEPRTPEEPSERAVRERLDRVTDPELDESIVALDYIDDIAVENTKVTVEFTLPTAWCSPAFAWMMATDARDEIESLPGVNRAVVRLREHMHDEEITEGVNERLTFGETFPDADGGVADVRATLDEKARLARQYDAVEACLGAGLAPDQIAKLRLTDISIDDLVVVFVREGTVGVSVSPDPVESYLEKARETGLVADERPELFRTPEGDPIPPDQFELVHRRCRLAGVNMGGQGSVCEALNDARHREGRPPLSPDDHIPEQ